MEKRSIARELTSTIKELFFKKKWGKESAINTDQLSENEIIVRKSYEELEQTIADLTTQVQNANKDLEDFTYSISHDLRAPLRAISGYINILHEDYSDKLDADGLSSLHAVLKNVKNMGNLIDDLLAFSRLSRKVVDTTEINMNSLVNAIKIDEMSDKSSAVNLIKQQLMPAKGQLAQIKQVWVSLISNALKFSQHNPQINIEIGSFVKDDSIVYFIKDNGVGFDMKYYDKLFKVFQRLHSNDEFEGTGIGLAIVKKIVTNHNGLVWAESKQNEGSCFYFSLPSI